MESTLEIWKTSRNNYLQYFDKYTVDQLNKIPEGFNNNLIWNIGHVIVAQQGLVYKSAGLPGYIPNEIAVLYSPGTKPTGLTSAKEMNELKGYLFSLIEQTENDLASGTLSTYTPRTTALGFHLGSLQDALEFNNYHEAMHFGSMLSIRKFV